MENSVKAMESKRKIEIIMNSLKIAHKCCAELFDENSLKRTQHSNSSSEAVFYNKLLQVGICVFICSSYSWYDLGSV